MNKDTHFDRLRKLEEQLLLVLHQEKQLRKTLFAETTNIKERIELVRQLYKKLHAIREIVSPPPTTNAQLTAILQDIARMTHEEIA